MQKAEAKLKLAAEIAAGDAAGLNPANCENIDWKYDVPCLPCEDQAYEHDLFFRNCSTESRLANEGVQDAASLTKPQRNVPIFVNS